ncbi:uncharacterized protein LOC114361068 [Ostrinia furnacalis]|uniref:uncharacterized protein LOC114361068 n=1 Tax=Ostrinia furnacalis TaxID=93504 RepID=UPI001038F333|nr:uncharacterized protein LOC114361068 [Ostrinia furnacalis]
MRRLDQHGRPQIRARKLIINLKKTTSNVTTKDFFHSKYETIKMPKNCLKYLIVLAVIYLLVRTCDCAKNQVKKFKRKVDDIDLKQNNLLQQNVVRNSTNNERSRGFFTPGLFSLGKVLNFFPVGGERECQPAGFTVARAGICLNAYDCRQRDGKAAGDCAHGLGVCCVFEVTCGGVVQNNLTYFLSPGFPELWSGERDCDITIEKTHAGITQLRVDFVHFTIGQPNRTTGECDEDAMTLGEGSGKVVICGQNHGQHLYYSLSSGSEVREAGELPSAKSTKLSIRMRGSEMPRLWLLRLAQMPLAYSAPHDCLQYFTNNNGTIKTFNFAINGRHLAGQEYRACIRRNVGFCAVRYVPCDSRSFRIGPGGNAPFVMDLAGVMQQEQLMPVNDAQVQDEEEGSGADPQMAPVVEANVAPPSLASRIWSFIWPSWLWGQSRGARTWGWSRWSPYAQHYTKEDDKFRYYGYGNFGVGLQGYGRLRCTDRITIPCENEYFVSHYTKEDDKFRYYGYGNFGVGLQGYGRQRCTDRITIPCENEYFVSSTSYIPGVCDPHHCGDSFCPGSGSDCRVETSISPFAVSVHFGPPQRKRSPEENIGACLRYTQLPCDG